MRELRATGSYLIPDMHSFGSTIFRTLAAAILAAGSLSGCVSVPEEVQLTHNGVQTKACETGNPLAARQEALDADGFSLTSWNMYKGKLNGWERDLDQLHQQSDLLLLQEAHLVSGLQDFLDQRTGDWAMARAFTLSDAWSGVMTLGKIPQHSPCAQRVDEPYLRLPKTALISYFPVSGHAKPLLVANIHGVNFTLGSIDLARQIAAIKQVIQGYDGPVVLAGDFNTWNEGRLEVVRRLAAEQGLQPVSFEQQPTAVLGRPLDHIYYRGLIPLHSQVTEVKSSDHYPLSVTFRLAPES